jgi:hypothetical protein
MTPERPPAEQFLLDLEPLEHYEKRTRALANLTRVRTESRVAIILILSLVLTLPLYIVVLLFAPTAVSQLNWLLEKWAPIMASLAGAAVGVSGRDRSRG